MALNVVIMAAGKGTRMKSALPKVLHRWAARAYCSMFWTPLPGWGRRAPSSSPATAPKRWKPRRPGALHVRQMPQLGTGHAMQQAVPALDDANDTTLILNGDVPLIARHRAGAGRGLRRRAAGAADHRAGRRHRLRPHPARRRAGAVRGIVEHKDASDGAAQPSARSTPASWPRPPRRWRAG
jgi:bifunctional UDP-N-acetylglucosamine pyrophosphorylase / glucosamine-1-phosphate N-acetyltransferase